MSKYIFGLWKSLAEWEFGSQKTRIWPRNINYRMKPGLRGFENLAHCLKKGRLSTIYYLFLNSFNICICFRILNRILKFITRADNCGWTQFQISWQQSDRNRRKQSNCVTTTNFLSLWWTFALYYSNKFLGKIKWTWW